MVCADYRRGGHHPARSFGLQSLSSLDLGLTDVDGPNPAASGRPHSERPSGAPFTGGWASAPFVSASPNVLTERAAASPSQKPFGQDEADQEGKRQRRQFEIPRHA
jgi:hypothetical protein